MIGFDYCEEYSRIVCCYFAPWCYLAQILIIMEPNKVELVVQFVQNGN